MAERKSIIIRFEFLGNELVSSILRINTTDKNDLGSIWEVVNTEYDSIATVIVSKIFEKYITKTLNNIIENGEFTSFKPGIYCMIYKDRFGIQKDEYTLTKIG